MVDAQARGTVISVGPGRTPDDAAIILHHHPLEEVGPNDSNVDNTGPGIGYMSEVLPLRS